MEFPARALTILLALAFSASASPQARDGMTLQPVAPEAGQAGTGDQLARPDVAADEQAVVEVVRTMFDALSKQDTARYRSVMAPGFYAFDMGKRMTADELAAVVEAARDAGMSFEWEVTEPNVRVEGPMAWVTYVNHGSMQRGTERQALTWLESAVLHKEAGAWRIQFLHSTPKSGE